MKEPISMEERIYEQCVSEIRENGSTQIPQELPKLVKRIDNYCFLNNIKITKIKKDTYYYYTAETEGYLPWDSITIKDLTFIEVAFSSSDTDYIQVYASKIKIEPRGFGDKYNWYNITFYRTGMEIMTMLCYLHKEESLHIKDAIYENQNGVSTIQFNHKNIYYS